MAHRMPLLEVEVADRAPRPHPYVAEALVPFLEALGEVLLSGHRAELSVLLASDRHMRELNATHRGQDKPTDVLSFPQEHALHRQLATPPSAGAAPLVLGDIVIAPQIALKQAAEWGWSDAERLAQLAIHGLLHLLGYDHDEETSRLEMEALEERLFTRAAARGLIAPLARTPG
jgi:rRNA maturation RNase YbeY